MSNLTKLLLIQIISFVKLEFQIAENIKNLTNIK